RRRERQSAGAHGPQRAGDAGAGVARRRGALDGHLPETVHRRDARIGQRAAAPRGAVQDMNWTVLINHIPALPEVLLLVGACVLMLADLRVKSERRTGTYAIAQVVL